MQNNYIEIIGGSENNLKNINLKIPKGKITVFTGVSGSGKSSIVFDIIAQESGRQLNETYNSFVRKFLPKYRRPKVDDIKNLSPAIIVDQKRIGGNARSTLGTATDINSLLRLLYSRFATPSIGYANAYSFNDPQGMCPQCEGIGRVITLNVDAALDQDKSLNEGAILLPGFKVGSYYWKVYAESGFFDTDKKIKDFSKEEFEKLVYAPAQKLTGQFLLNDMNVTYEGLVERFMRTTVNTDKDATKASTKKINEFGISCICPTCNGKRYHELVFTSKINGYSIYDLTDMELEKLVAVLGSWDIREANHLIQDVREKVQSLCDIGLSYLTLTRETTTLSGGESQRVKMVKHLSGNLNGLIYVFDEPSTGLHPHDVNKINDLLVKIRDKGNTVLIVEHDPDVIPIADHVVDVGPGAGSHGGTIMFSGAYKDFLKSSTLTAKCLVQESKVNQSGRIPQEFYRSTKSSLHNLKNISLNIPKGLFTVVTGVAGSGKSSLVNGVFAKEFPESIVISQSPVHQTARSNSATYLGIMDEIRALFAKENGVEKGLFSYNSIGACPACNGTGFKTLNMSFMDVIEVECTECNGTRYRTDVLKYLYKGKNIVEMMGTTAEEALEIFNDNKIKSKLKGINTVGLSYLTLGQSLDTLSGGECQRLKLAKELGAKGNIYILDEPTTGLHMSDVKVILSIINKLVDRGNTVIVIEHNTDMIRNADWIIDIGPEGGSRGGRIIYEGNLGGLQICSESVTAKFVQ
ncbi:ATP-binding cassette domain-containing protein [Cellulosilyticum sp. I15G10I2]|uniref:ATP-binding cassette domain-containing protein n=1 Tax=Cellulosilyticum sp. I15G10I2 TaxID=1892843 RepID=UPI00085BD51F|nr:excinuclease ABC subunit UvrA [Cellulosilyticum sp. I15G10I2]